MHYLLGGQMPKRYQDWVAQDLLTDGWRHRQALRLVLLSAPFALIFLLLPGSITVRVTAALVILLSSLGLQRRAKPVEDLHEYLRKNPDSEFMADAEPAERVRQ